MARITHPRPQVGTIVDRLGGVIFRDGFAEVDLSDKPNLAAAYAQHGYVVEEPAPIIDLTKLSARELRDVADVEGIEYPAKATKAQLVDLISRVPAASIDDPDGEQMPAYIVPLTTDED